MHLVLIHGGLWEDMDAERFWDRPGIVAGLRAAGCTVTAPDRLRRAPSWVDECAHVAGLLPPEPSVVVAGSNGCGVAVRLAVDRPDLVRALLLAWPVTAADPRIDAGTRGHLAAAGASTEICDTLLTGDTLRGIADDELRGLRIPVGVLRSEPANRFHLASTVDALLGLIPGVVELPGCPEPPRPEFPPYRDRFLATVLAFGRADAVGP
jgi:hypothetical protein